MSDHLRDLIASSAWKARSSSELAAAVIATRVPGLCPDCKGQGVINLPEYEGRLPDCPHPNAPTLADTVALWEAVRTPATPTNYQDALDALRAERDALQAKVDAIDALHQPTPYAHLTVCGQCDANWPCPTHRILHPEGDTPT